MPLYLAFSFLSFLRNPKEGLTRDTFVFAVCFLLSLMLLFLNKLSANYIGEIDARVAYINQPQEKISAAPLQEELKLFVETSGFKLLWAKVLKPARLRIDLANLTRTNYALTDDYRSSLLSQLPEGYRLVEIKPDTLFFLFDQSSSKKVPVEPDIQISFRKQFDLSEPVMIKPDSITIRGPENVIEKIESWKTKKLSYNDLHETIQDKVALEISEHPAVQLQPAEVRFLIAVEEYTEKKLEVEIQKINVPASKEISIYPKKVTVLVRVAMSNYEQVQDTSFVMAANFEGVELGKSKYVAVKVEKQPSYVKNLDYSPKSVEFIVYN